MARGISFLMVLLFAGCASTQREVEILGFDRLVITDIGSDNIMPTAGPAWRGSGQGPVSGVPVGGSVAFDQGGILSASKVRIQGATGSTIIIQRAVTGNHNLGIDAALGRIFEPSGNPFGDIIMDGDEYMKEGG